MLQIEKVSKTYHSKGIDYPVLKEISATIHDGEFVAIMGPSGSGKTTLLNVISGFISADGGKVILDGQDILTGEENELAEIRQHKLGFVFQDFMLLNGLTIRENIFLPQIIAGKPKSQMEQNTHNLLAVFGIEEIAEKHSEIYNDYLVIIDSLAESSINIRMIAYVKTNNLTKFRKVKEQILFEAIKRFREEGIEFAFPSRSLYIASSNEN